MKLQHDVPILIALLALTASCATQAPPAAPPPPAAQVAPPPNGSQRLPGVVTCESEVSCSACADDRNRELVRLAFRVHANEVRACHERVAPGAERHITFRVGFDPSGAVGTSCVVRTTLNDPAVESCLTDVILKWRFPPPPSGGWALVDSTFALGR
jgi:hypothetical protein